MTETPPTPDVPSTDAPEAASADSPWSAPSSLAPDAALLQQVGYITAEPKHDCVLLGPSGAGKSSFLSALGRACQGQVRHGFKVAVIPGAALTELAGEAARLVDSGQAGMTATAEPVSYDFQLTVESQTEPLDVEVIAQDLPGGEIFGVPGGDPLPLRRSPHARLCLQAARRASCLILCIDALQPDRLRWEILLPQLIDNLSVSSGRLIARLSRLGQSDLPPMLSPKRQLPFKKILVLLTKIDKVCEAVASASAASGLLPGGPIPPLLSRLVKHPRELAERLDPLRLIEDRLGKAFLGQLHAAAAPDTSLAVALVSARGFRQSAATGTAAQAIESPGLEEWLPFGVWESMLFIGKGVARQPVQQFTSVTSTRSESLSSVRLSLGGHR